MKRFLSFFLSFCFVLFFVNFANAEIKIGVVDLYRVLNESEEGKKAINELQNMADSRQKTLEDKQKKIQTLKEEYDKKKAVLSEDARKTKEEEIERLVRDLQRTQADYQVEFQKKYNEINQSMLKEIIQIINEYAKKEGYKLILPKADMSIIYSTPEIEITDKIIALFNQKTSAQKGKK